MTRLIDGNALLVELINGGYDLDFDEVPETKRELLRMIMEQPTVDAVPVRHGKWTRHTVGSAEYGTTVMYRCNACDMMTISKFKYCPHCGAKMGERKEE